MDQFRFIHHLEFESILSAPRFNCIDFEDQIQKIKIDMPGCNYQEESKIINLKTQYLSVPIGYKILQQFINSTDFLYIPVPEHDIKTLNGDDFHNNERAKEISLSRYLTTMVRTGLSEQTLLELKIYKEQYGDLPTV